MVFLCFSGFEAQWKSVCSHFLCTLRLLPWPKWSRVPTPGCFWKNTLYECVPGHFLCTFFIILFMSVIKGWPNKLKLKRSSISLISAIITYLPKSKTDKRKSLLGSSKGSDEDEAVTEVCLLVLNIYHT